jgi:Holliday junction resolvase RusA-like endonuclease
MRGSRPSLYTPTKTANYEGLVAMAAQTALAGRPRFEGPVAVCLQIDCEVPASWSKKKQAQAYTHEVRPTTKPDVDNVVKAIFDGCNEVLWRDDVQVVDVMLSKRYAVTPGVHVTVRPARMGGMQGALLEEAA